MNEDELCKKIVIKLIECILQSRINVDREQIKHFGQLTTIKNKYEINEYSLYRYLDNLIKKQKYELKNLINKNKNYEDIIIFIQLVHKLTGVITKSEVWLIQFYQNYKRQIQNQQQQFQIVVAFFQEILFFLNKQPLFVKYHRNSLIKKYYMLDYFLKIGRENNKDSVDKNHQNLMQLPYKYTKRRVCQLFTIQIECYYLPKLDELFENECKRKSTQQSKNNSTMQESIEVNDKSRKVSIYEYYDKELDFIFLSSDDETFKNSPRNEIKSVDINIDEEEEQNFQLLIINKDNQFLDDNQNLFSQLSNFQKHYLKI